MIENLELIVNYTHKEKFTLKTKAIMYSDEILHTHEWNVMETDIDNPNHLSIVKCKQCSLTAVRKSVDKYSPPSFQYFVQNNGENKDTCKLRYIKNIIQ